MKRWVIILDSCEIIANCNLSIKLFLYFPDKCLPGCFTGFYLPAWKLPSVFIITISSLCGKNLISITDDSSYHVYSLHVITIYNPVIDLRSEHPDA